MKQKKEFGAYYTPVPIVDYMVRMVDDLIVNELILKDNKIFDKYHHFKSKCNLINE